MLRLSCQRRTLDRRARSSSPPAAPGPSLRAAVAAPTPPRAAARKLRPPRWSSSGARPAGGNSARAARARLSLRYAPAARALATQHTHTSKHAWKAARLAAFPWQSGPVLGRSCSRQGVSRSTSPDAFLTGRQFCCCAACADLWTRKQSSSYGVRWPDCGIAHSVAGPGVLRWASTAARVESASDIRSLSSLSLTHLSATASGARLLCGAHASCSVPCADPRHRRRYPPTSYAYVFNSQTHRLLQRFSCTSSAYLRSQVHFGPLQLALCVSTVCCRRCGRQQP